MVSEAIRKRVYKLMGDAFVTYLRHADPQALRIAEGYFHVLSQSMAEHLWAVHPLALDLFETEGEWMDHVGQTFFISYLNMPAPDILTLLQSEYDDDDWDLMFLDEAAYSLVSPADIMLSNARYEIYDYDIERMAIALKLIEKNGIQLPELQSIPSLMAKAKDQVLWTDWKKAANNKLTVNEDGGFKEQLLDVFLYNIELFFDFSDQDNFDQDDRSYPILTKELCEHLINCGVIKDPKEWRLNIGNHVYIWQYDMENYVTPDKMLEKTEFEDSCWYFMTYKDAVSFLENVKKSISTECHITLVDLWWSGAMLYFLEKFSME